MTTWHVFMPIHSAENSTDKALESMFGGSAVEIRKDLLDMKRRGMTVIPSEGCDNQAPSGHCLGHHDG